MSRGHEAYLYVATDGELFKIGVTDDPAGREYGLGVAVKFIKVWRRPYARQLENAIKGMFAYARARGNEWFAVTEKEMLFIVQRTIRILDDDYAIKRGLEPSKRPSRGEPSFVPPFELAWLKNSPTR